MTKTVIAKDVFGNEYECNVADLDVGLGVYAAIVTDGKILLARQWDGYSIIGGGVDKGETLEEAFVREVKEETGLIATPGRLIHHATTFFQRDEQSAPRQSYQFYFTHASLAGEIHNNHITDSEKIYTNSVPEWIDLNDIHTINFRHSVPLETILRAY